MVITDIKKGKKSNIYLYVDGKYYLSLKDEILVKSGLKVGSCVDEEILYNLKKESGIYRAKEKAFNLLSYRNRSKKELKERLEREVDEKSADIAIKKVENLGLINDRSFAREYAIELLFNKRVSVSLVKYKLQFKGISDEIIEEILESLPVDEEKQVLYLLRNKFSYKMKDEEGIKRVISSIKRLGYNWDTIKRALSFYNDGITEDELI